MGDISDSPEFRRLIIGNAPEWGIQPERHALPGNNSLVQGQPFPDDEMALFWSGDNKHVVTRHELDQSHVADCSFMLGYRNVTCATPSAGTNGSSICASLLEEPSIRSLAESVDLAGCGTVFVESYGATPQYFDLIDVLRSRTPWVIHDCMTARQDIATITRLDSKIQVREFFAQLPASLPVRMTRAFSSASGPGLRRDVVAARHALGPVLLKTEFAAGGHGMALVDELTELDEQLASLLAPRGDTDLLLEEHISAGDAVMPMSFSARVGADGTVASIGVGRELRYSTRFYAGMHIGLGSVADDYADIVSRAGLAIGQLASLFGFRGAFSLDFLCRLEDSGLYPLEVNPRRSLGSTLVDICTQLYGPDYAQRVSAIARRRIPVHRSIDNWGRLRDFLDHKMLLGDCGDFLVLPYMVNTLPAQAFIGLAVIGSDTSVVEAALNEIMDYLAEGPAVGSRAAQPETLVHG